MGLLEHAKRELKIAGLLDDPDEIQQMMNKHILEMVELFANEGHSGFSGTYAMGMLFKLLDFKPITPLTGEDSEWNEVGDGVWQNNRCSTIFKTGGLDTAYNIEGIVYRDQRGNSFTNQYSCTPVTFPYTPTEPQYVTIYDRSIDD